MKKNLSIAAGLIASAMLMSAASPAMAVDVGVSIAVPGVYIGVPSVYVQPRPVYVQPEREQDWRERNVRAHDWQERQSHEGHDREDHHDDRRGHDE